jgi:large exoprotein involved in heme utilization and adhesion
MDTHTIRSTAHTPLLVLSLAMVLAGCNSAPPATDDASLDSEAQIRLASDQTIGPESIQTSVSNGIVTLTGTVSNPAGRTIAGGDIAQIPGVKKVVNNIVVPAPPAPKQTVQPPAQQVPDAQDTSTS